MKRIATLIFSLLSIAAAAQTYNPAKTTWQTAGYKGTRPAFSRTINILSYSADQTGVASSNTALGNAISALNGAPGVILFPPGTYFFDASLRIDRDSIVFRGAGHDSTSLLFDFAGQISNGISITGTQTQDTALLTASAERGTFIAMLQNAAPFHAGDWITLSMNDAAYMSSTWAYGSLSQTMQIERINDNTVTFNSPFRATYPLSNSPVIRRMVPRNNIGFECLKIRREDATAGQASNLVFDRAVNCWVSGLEGDSANFAHIEINRSSNIEITNSYFHDAFAYGGNGQAYGVLLQFGSNECKVEANYFDHLRHSMLLQAGANGNVLAYNYSTHPFWTEPGLPDSSAGDIVLHGNYPFMNLAEGNVVQNIVIDDSHGRNGPLNTFFRNRAEGYGIFMNFNPATDSVQFIGNEITNTSIGLNFISGRGHFIYGNNYRGTVTGGSAAIPDTSLYLSAGQKPPCADSYDAWPVIGRPGGYNTGTIYAQARVGAGEPAACSCPTAAVATAVMPIKASGMDWIVYPNPANNYVEAKGIAADRMAVFDLTGALLLLQERPAGNRISTAQLPAGVYMLRIMVGGTTVSRRLVIAK